MTSAASPSDESLGRRIRRKRRCVLSRACSIAMRRSSNQRRLRSGRKHSLYESTSRLCAVCNLCTETEAPLRRRRSSLWLRDFVSQRSDEARESRETRLLRCSTSQRPSTCDVETSRGTLESVVCRFFLSSFLHFGMGRFDRNSTFFSLIFISCILESNAFGLASSRIPFSTSGVTGPC